MYIEHSLSLDIWVAVNALARRGIPLGEKALRAYVREGLAPAPVVMTTGGRGRRAMYPADLAEQAAASFALVSRYPGHKVSIARARAIAVHCVEHRVWSAEAMRADSDLRAIIGTDIWGDFASDWLAAYLDLVCVGDRSDAHYRNIVATAVEGNAMVEIAREELARRHFWRNVMGRVAQLIAAQAALAEVENNAGA